MRKLNIDRKIGYILAIAILAASLIVIFLPSKYVLWTAAILFFLAAPATLALVKKRSIHSYHKRQVLLLLTVIAVLFLMLFYLSGIFFGFAAAQYRLSFKILFSSVIPIVSVIVFSEMVRSPLIAEGERMLSVMTYAVCVLADVMIAGGARGITSGYLLADFLGMTLFPAITSNILFHYISKRYGMLPNISYRAILALYTYLIPIVPNAPAILPAFFLMILPLISRAFIDVLFEKIRKAATVRKSKLRFIFPTVLLIIATAFIMLVSCKFRYGIIVIATSSMSDEINRGDAVVYETYEKHGRVEENDVIIFQSNEKTRVVHRIVAINTIDGQTQYITKGDANESIDPGYVTDNDIIGVVHFKVLYLGFPSLWLREAFTN